MVWVGNEVFFKRTIGVFSRERTTLVQLYKSGLITIILIIIITILMGALISIFPNQFKAPRG